MAFHLWVLALAVVFRFADLDRVGSASIAVFVEVWVSRGKVIG